MLKKMRVYTFNIGECIEEWERATEMREGAEKFFTIFLPVQKHRLLLNLVIFMKEQKGYKLDKQLIILTDNFPVFYYLKKSSLGP